MAFGRDGKRLWSINLKAGTSSARRWSRINTVWFLTADGNLHVRARSDGAELDRISLGILPDGGLLQAGQAGPRLRGKGHDSSRDGRASHRRPTLNRAIERQVS